MTEPVSTAAALAIAKPLVSKVIDSLLKPVINIGRGVIDPLVDVLGNRFSEYLERQLLKHSYLPTIVFQIRQPIGDIYIPLTVCEESSHGEKDKNVTLKLDHYVYSFIPKTKKVLLIDSAGMGKTTASRFLFIESIKSVCTIPIFIELRHLSNNKNIIDYVLSELNPSTSDSSSLKIDKRQLIRLLDKGVFTFFLDGYDEISTTSREQVTIDIKDLTNTYPSNNFIITSRPEHALASFPAFQAFRIVPLQKEEAFELIRKYDRGGEKGERLIARLQDETLPEVDNFLENPLLTTLLYRAYDYKAQIPLKKPNFYRQVFDALFEWHDLTKDGYSTREKVCKLDIDGFHKILRGIGFISVLKGKVETDTDEMLKWIRESKTYAPELRFSESEFLEDAIKAVPIFRREGNAILWSHKSLSEYFCAQFIVSDAKSDQSGICEHLSGSFDLPVYFNVLDLIYDMDISLFGTQFIKPLLKFYQSEIVRLSSLYPKIPADKIELRVCASIGSMPFLLHENGKGLTIEIQNRLKEVSRGALLDWFDMEAIFEPQSLVDRRLQIDVRRSDKYRLYSISHPLKTVFSLLIKKKHPVVLLRALYPDSFAKGKISGLRNINYLRINETQTAVCNNLKNFSSTTAALAQSNRGIINAKHVESALREIEQMSSRSQTTASLLQNLNVHKSQ